MEHLPLWYQIAQNCQRLAHPRVAVPRLITLAVRKRWEIRQLAIEIYSRMEPGAFTQRALPKLRQASKIRSRCLSTTGLRVG